MDNPPAKPANVYIKEDAIKRLVLRYQQLTGFFNYSSASIAVLAHLSALSEDSDVTKFAPPQGWGRYHNAKGALRQVVNLGCDSFITASNGLDDIRQSFDGLLKEVLDTVENNKSKAPGSFETAVKVAVVDNCDTQAGGIVAKFQTLIDEISKMSNFFVSDEKKIIETAINLKNLSATLVQFVKFFSNVTNIIKGDVKGDFNTFTYSVQKAPDFERIRRDAARACLNLVLIIFAIRAYQQMYKAYAEEPVQNLLLFFVDEMMFDSSALPKVENQCTGNKQKIIDSLKANEPAVRQGFVDILQVFM